MNKISIIIPTKDRLNFLKNTLKNLDKNNFFFDEIIIVDSSLKKIRNYNLNFLSFKIKRKIKLIYSSSGTALQRNIGLKNINRKNEYVMFLDDDIIFEKRALNKMSIFLKNIPNFIIGIGFNNNLEIKKNFIEKIKKTKFIKKLKIYSDNPGIVTKSGWQTKITKVNFNRLTYWLSTQASIFNLKKIKKINFDENLGIYSYLEDLDFSYKVSKLGKLIIYSKSFYITKNIVSRSNLSFGIKELLNRYIFVKNNKLSKKYFLIGSFILTLKNLAQIFFFDIKKFNRGLGNLISYIFILKK
tara:strand:+ start:549 stop:1445 length:897 start_codon:yes stop_codon:yes gene_type:complete